jgi:predicted Zn-dependent protease
VRRFGLMLLPAAFLAVACSTAKPQSALREPTARELSRLSDALAPFEKTVLFATPECPVRIGVMTSAQIDAAVMVTDLTDCPYTVQLMVTEGTLALPYLELRGIMAHEMGHVALRHGPAMATRRQNKQGAKTIASSVFNTIGVAASAMPGYGAIIQLGAWIAGVTTETTIGLIARGYYRDQEREADEWGTQFLARYGLSDCLAMASVFDRMRESGGLGLTFFNTHPGPSDRADAVRRTCRSGAEVGARPEDVRGR